MCAIRNFVILPWLHCSCFRRLESLCRPAWYCSSHALRSVVGCSILVVTGVSKVKGCSLLGMDGMLLYASVIFCCNACLWSACDTAWSIP